MHLQTSEIWERNEIAYKSGKRFIVNQGGSRSGKTYSLIQLLIVLALQERLAISITSIAFPHLRKGAIRDFMEIMENAGLYDPNLHFLTESLYKFPNGSYIEFFSVDNSMKVRGPGRDILFINEANLIQKETFEQLNMRTRKTVFIDYNPADEQHWIYERILPLKDTEFIQSSYLDNPFLPDIQKQQIESLKDADPNLWKVYGLGERGTTQNTIYHKFELYDEIEGEHVYGLDFGFNHPNALVKITRVENKLYAEQKLYQSHLTTSELIKKVKDIVGNSFVYCDTARPEIIQDLMLNGINAFPADKSVKEGIDFIRSHKIHIHRDSVDLQKEMRSYKWKQKPNGEILDEPVKIFDDLCFIGDTEILTIKGFKKIKEIKQNEYIINTSGKFKVLNLFDNGVKQITKYRMHFDTFFIDLSCTDNHIIKTGKKWKEISKLESGEMVYLTKHSMVKNISFIQTAGILCNISTICITSFGNITMANVLKGFTCIILMATLGIISPVILLLLKLKIICQNTHLKDLNQIQSIESNFIKQVLKQLKNGINQKKEKNGIYFTLNELDLVEKMSTKILVSNVAKFILTTLHILMGNSVILTAKLKHLEKGERWKEKVYDLEIESVHEYSANGLIVHNCDSFRYGAISFKNSYTAPILIGYR